jgi:hypothetical protein
VDSLAQGLYLRIFNWIISKINETFHQRSDESGSQGPAAPAVGAGGRKYRGGQKVESFSLSLLDLFGFEDYERGSETQSTTGNMNGFEQFLVNYCNEKLHSVFYLDHFSQENQLFLDEGCPHFTPWGYDNSECLSLFESERGLLKLIDEHCLLSRAHQDDLTLLNLFCNTIGAPTSGVGPGAGSGGGSSERNKFFHCSLLLKKRVTGENTFSISHYDTASAAQMTDGHGGTRYYVQGFTSGNIEKPEMEEALRQSTNPVLAMALKSDQDEEGQAPSEPPPGRMRPGRGLLRQSSSSVGSSRKIKKTKCQFVKNSLSVLLTEATTNTKLHFLRSLRPNFDVPSFSSSSSGSGGGGNSVIFQREAVSQQLTSSGFFDLLEMKSKGFPHRYRWKDLLLELVNRDCLASSVLSRTNQLNPKDFLQKFLRSSCPPSDPLTSTAPRWFEGKSGLVYLQSSIFDQLRLQRSDYSSNLIQKNWRLHRFPILLRHLTSSLGIVKRALRTFLNRRRYQWQRETTRTLERSKSYLLKRWRYLIRVRRRRAVTILWHVLRRKMIRNRIERIRRAQEKITNFLQMKRLRRHFLDQRRAVVKLQSQGRGLVYRHRYRPLILEVKARMHHRLCEFSAKRIAWYPSPSLTPSLI